MQRLVSAPASVTVLLSLCANSCQSGRAATAYRTAPRIEDRDPVSAQKFNENGLALVEKGEYESAETAFRKALELDLYNVAAHNNLGLVLLHSNRGYEAAWEFDCAVKLAPSAAEPRTNLGLVYEKTGRLDRAVTEYESALAIDPSHAVAMRHLARAYVKTGSNEDRLKTLLERMLLSPGEPQWDVWARGQLVRIGRDSNCQSLPTPTDE